MLEFSTRDTVEQQNNQQLHTQPAHVVHQPIIPVNNAEATLPPLITTANDLTESPNQLPVIIHESIKASNSNIRTMMPFLYRTPATTS